jgi:hypothetical protein
VENRADDRWRREREPVERLRKLLSAPVAAPETTFCFSIEGKPGRPGATVWLERRGPNKLVVPHIVAAERRALTDEEYNGILVDFESSVLRPLIHDLDVDLRIISPRAKLEESISPDAMASLRAFSSNAKRSQSYEDLDWQTWKRFLIQAHLDGSVLESADLEWWLEQENWPEEERRQLAGLYRTSLSLLAEYDEERVPS